MANGNPVNIPEHNTLWHAITWGYAGTRKSALQEKLMDRYDKKSMKLARESSRFLESMKSRMSRGNTGPYPESTLLLWLSRLRRARDTLGKGTRHIGPLASV